MFNAPATTHLSDIFSTTLALIILLTLLSGCATTPDTGIRKDFEQTRVHTVAIVPFYARASFGMEPQHFAEVRETYEAVATAALREQGFEVIDPRAFRQHLIELGVWELFQEGIYLRQSLTSYFEPGSSGNPSIEVLTLAALADDDAFPAQALLFGEIVYQSEGTCRAAASEFTPYARQSVMSGSPGAYPRPCVSSHFQAKLVDPQSGHTMWFNRMFHETHSRQIDAQITRENIARAVRAALAEESGLAPLAPSQQEVADND